VGVVEQRMKPLPTFFVNVKLWLHSFFLEQEDIKSISLVAIWNISKVTKLPLIDMGHKGAVN